MECSLVPCSRRGVRALDLLRRIIYSVIRLPTPTRNNHALIIVSNISAAITAVCYHIFQLAHTGCANHTVLEIPILAPHIVAGNGLIGTSVFGGVIGTGGATPSFLLLPQAVRRASAMPAARTPRPIVSSISSLNFSHFLLYFFGKSADFIIPPPHYICQSFFEISASQRKNLSHLQHFNEKTVLWANQRSEHGFSFMVWSCFCRSACIGTAGCPCIIGRYLAWLRR